jgi:DNA-directed RNA polymerase specialized sigma24 family protein
MTETTLTAPVRYDKESVQQLREVMRHLPPEEKEVFLLRQNGEWAYEQIAQFHARSVEVVKDQMRSALGKPRAVFERSPSVGLRGFC